MELWILRIDIQVQRIIKSIGDPGCDGAGHLVLGKVDLYHLNESPGLDDVSIDLMSNVGLVDM